MERYKITRGRSANCKSIEDLERGVSLEYEGREPYIREGDIEYYTYVNRVSKTKLEVQYFNYPQNFHKKYGHLSSLDQLKKSNEINCRSIVISFLDGDPNFSTEEVMNLVIHIDEHITGIEQFRFREVSLGDCLRIVNYE